MAESLQLEFDSRALQKRLNVLPAQLFVGLRKAGTRVGTRYLSYHAAQRLRGGPGVQSSRGKRGIRGHFRQEVSGRRLDNLTLRIFTRSRVALEHEEGRRLRPYRGKVMAVPLKDARSTRGKVKETAKRYLREGKLTFVQTRGRKKFLVQDVKRGKAKGTRKWLYVLVRAVQLKPRLAFRALWPDWKRSKGLPLWRSGVSWAIRSTKGGKTA